MLSRFLILDIPELQEVVGAKILNEDDSQLIQKAFRSILTCSNKEITNAIDGILRRFRQSGKKILSTLYFFDYKIKTYEDLEFFIEIIKIKMYFCLRSQKFDEMRVNIL